MSDFRLEVRNAFGRNYSNSWVTESLLLLRDHFFFIHLERRHSWIGLHVMAPNKLTFYYYYYYCDLAIEQIPHSTERISIPLLAQWVGTIVSLLLINHVQCCWITYHCVHLRVSVSQWFYCTFYFLLHSMFMLVFTCLTVAKKSVVILLLAICIALVIYTDW